VIAWKFTAPGAVGPFSRLSWPQPSGTTPGDWVVAAVNPCSTGIHACGTSDLSYWLNSELWEVELDGDVIRAGHKIVAPRGRLLRRIETWDRHAMRRFCLDCQERVRAYAADSEAAAEYLEDLADDVDRGLAATARDDASRAAEAAGGADAREAERIAQSRWLVGRLGLRADASSG
jgi:hypothetical protein